MKITKKACKALCRLAAAQSVPAAYSPADDGKEIMFTDSCAVCIRVPADYMRHIDGVTILHDPDTKPGSAAARTFAWIDSHAGYTLAAVTPAHDRSANRCRVAPVLRDDLRKFATYRRRADKYPVYPLGKGFYNPSYIALVLDVLPDAVIYAAGPLDPLYIVGENGCAFVMPIKAAPAIASDARSDLEQFRNTATAADNAPKLENQPEKVTAADIPADAATTKPAHNDGANAFRAVSSSTLAQLMQQKGIPCSGKYAEIDSFYTAVLTAGETLPAVDGETWPEFFERAYPVAFPGTACQETTVEAPATVNVDIYAFAEQFQKEYDQLYESEHVAGYQEAVEAFGRACNGESFRRFVAQFAKFRGDLVSSGREAAGFMFALDACVPGGDCVPVAAQHGSHYDPDKAYNSIPAAVEAFYAHVRPLYGETLFDVRFDHVDGSGFWFSYELTHDHRRQVYCVRHADLDGYGVQHSPHFDRQPPKVGCRLPGGDGIIDPVNLEWMQIMVSDWMADQGLTDDDIVIDWDGFSEKDQTVPCCDSSHCYLLEAVHGDIHIVPIGAL
jgi:hypothetical protein